MFFKSLFALMALVMLYSFEMRTSLAMPMSDDSDLDLDMDPSISMMPNDLGVDPETPFGKILTSTANRCRFTFSNEERQNFSATIRELRQSVARRGSCKSDVCFAIDGSNAIDPYRFDLQRRFVELVVSLLAVRSNPFFAAVQYATTTFPIEPPTTDDAEFIRSLNEVEQVNTSDRNIAAALGYCGFQLKKRPSAILVIIGNGESTVGFDPSILVEGIKDLDGKPPTIFGISSAGDINDFEKVVGPQRSENILRLRGCRQLQRTLVTIVSRVCNT